MDDVRIGGDGNEVTLPLRNVQVDSPEPGVTVLEALVGPAPVKVLDDPEAAGPIADALDSPHLAGPRLIAEFEARDRAEEELAGKYAAALGRVCEAAGIPLDPHHPEKAAEDLVAVLTGERYYTLPRVARDALGHIVRECDKPAHNGAEYAFTARGLTFEHVAALRQLLGK